ncbi:MAG: zinc-binding dehydrogenase [Mangrovibacterium sp.]
MLTVNIALHISQTDNEVMEALTKLLKEGALKPHIAEVLPFSEMVKAHQLIESKRTVGKIVVEL